MKDYSNMSYGDLWDELEDAKTEGEWTEIWNEIERRRDLYR